MKSLQRKNLQVTLHVSVWVEMKTSALIFKSAVVTLHVSVWVEMTNSNGKPFLFTGHAPRERVSWNNYCKIIVAVFCSSRSTWACELKSRLSFKCGSTSRHAPRERVSWNRPERLRRGAPLVTLHVSVWVEILGGITYGKIHRVTLHVSVWVEILIAGTLSFGIASHAPRERVSWNILEEKEKNSSAGSRSTWACELKWHWYMVIIVAVCHAPRERVSWNSAVEVIRSPLLVTLHVSVWVEILRLRLSAHLYLSRSTWACELKFWDVLMALEHTRSRSTWACELKF